MNTSNSNPKLNTEPEKPEAAMNAQERDPFGLAALPELQPAADGWNTIAARLQQERARRRQWISGLAIAATVTLVAGIVSILPQQGALTTPVEQTADNPSNPPLQESDNLAALQNLSQRLEQNLVYLSSSVGPMPAEMVVYQVELEDLVAQVDAGISQQPDSSELWQQRVNLLMDLNQVYGEGLRRDDPYVASL